MVSWLPDVNSALILAPHPDDEALGCSGSIALMNKGGVSSRVAFLTSGERLYESPSASVAERRMEEARKASEILGCREPIFLNFPDGELGNHEEGLYQELCRVIEINKPDIVFSPSSIDFHQDHIASARVALRLLNTSVSFKLAFYEVYSTLRFNQLVDITEAIEIKKSAIMNYSKSLYDKPEVYLHAALGLNAQRSIFTQKSGYYEAFWIIEKPAGTQEIKDWLTYLH